MDSEDSRDDSSGSESNDNGPQSPDSVKSHGDESNRSRSRSRSRSSTPSSRAQSAASQHSSDSLKSANSDFNRSRSSSVEKEKVRSSLTPTSPVSSKSPLSPKSPKSPKSPASPKSLGSPHSPVSPKSSLNPKSPISAKSISSPNSLKSSKSPFIPKSPSSPRSPMSPKSTMRDRSPTCQSPSPTANKDSHSSRSSSAASRHSPKPDSPVTHSPIHNDSSPRIHHLPKSDSKSVSPKRREVSTSPERDNVSIKSDSSFGSRKSRPRSRHSSQKSISSRSRSRSNSSDISSSSIDSSSRRNKNVTKNVDTQPEEISDGDIDLDQEKDGEAKNPPKNEINISHEDLSDVSDLEDSMGEHSEDEITNLKKDTVAGSNTEDRNSHHDIKKIVDTTHRSEEAEEQLDFEAEDGECEAEVPTTKDKDESEEKVKDRNGMKVEEKTDEKTAEEKEELEEGEVTDEDDVRPEETEPRPVCRFFSRGQCTWGASCRFLHPGVTDKGNYTMFELIRPVVPGEFGRDDRLYGKVDPPLVESAWERGLRTAKEMLRKSSKRKEQDIDFEEKKMNLTLAQEEFDKENGYYGRVASPEPRYVRHVTATDYPIARPQPEEYYGPPRRQIMYEPEYAAPIPRERARPYRELPSHRMPDYYDDKYNAAVEEAHQSSKKGRAAQGSSKREVIVQRVAEERTESGRDRERQTQGRGDEWSDPWMRLRSPAGGPSRRRTAPGERKRSYSSGSSYSSSSSSRSSSDSSRSTYKSRSNSPRRRRTSRSRRRSRHVSPSVIVSERKAANERAALMNPPAPKRRAPSPGMMRVSVAANPPAPLRDDRQHSRSKLAVAAALARVKGAARRRSSRSSSASSASSSSDSDSSDSSSSSSRGGSSPSRRAPGVDLSLVKAMDALKGGSLEKKQIKLNLKTPVGVKKSDIVEFARKTDPSLAKKRPANSPPPAESKSKKATSRREELLKQLKAVEDAIAKKRSKVN